LARVCERVKVSTNKSSGILLYKYCLTRFNAARKREANKTGSREKGNTSISLPQPVFDLKAMVEEKLQSGLAGRIRSLFNGRSTISSQRFPSSVVSPKSPAPRLGLSILASPTIDLPGLPSHLSPPSRVPMSPHSFRGMTSPTGVTVAPPPSARSRRSHSTIHPPSSCPLRSEPNSPRRNWGWEHVRNSSGSTRRRRTRRKELGRPPGAIKGILREKAGRIKLIRCLGLGILLGVGLTVCTFDHLFELTSAYLHQILR
jgi:hypothetical protein